MNAKYTWNDLVTIAPNAPEQYKRYEIGVVVGVSTIDTPRLADKFGLPIGSTVYLIEGSDGDALEVPELYLRPYAPPSNPGAGAEGR
jgi:hypothetical protein